jgi:predicted 3-demethylubiquinone-9 3-methyltransferase (glyoxalase superfamily)
MNKIIPHFWYDTDAMEAVKLYTRIFDDSEIIESTIIEDTPSGDAEVVEFKLAGSRFSAISAGPYFKFNPSVSLMVYLKRSEDVDRICEALVKGGSELMPLGEYSFSKRYAWISDQYGLNWQLMLSDKFELDQVIVPSLLFSNKTCGRAGEAIDHYLSVFPESEKSTVSSYEAGEAMDDRAKINYSEINLLGEKLILMDHGMGGDFDFNEAVSFQVMCDDQAEIDYYWEKLSFYSEAEQCGWIKDKFSVSWQIVPANLNQIMARETKEEVKKVTQMMLGMKKIEIDKLKA